MIHENVINRQSRISPVRDRLWLPFTEGDSASQQYIETELKRFFDTHGPDALAINFCSQFPAAFCNHSRCKNWLEAFSYDQSFRHWSEAYERVNQILSATPAKLRNVIDYDYHNTARQFRQLFVLQAVDTEFACDLCILAPFDLILTYQERKSFRLPHSALASTLKQYRYNALRHLFLFKLFLLNNLSRLATWLYRLATWLKKIGFYLVRRTLMHLSNLSLYLTTAATFRIRRVTHWAFELTLLPYRKQQEHRVRRSHTMILKRSLALKSGPEGITILTVDDSGTNVNLNPAIEIIREFEACRRTIVVITSYETVARAVRKVTRAPVYIVSEYSALLTPRYGHTQTLFSFQHNRLHGIDAAGLRLFLLRLTELERQYALIHALLNEIEKNSAIKAILTVYECLPISVSAGRWATERGIPWIGFFPILVGDRPDGYHFPAPEHLVYGEQLRDQICNAGHSDHSIEVVGSPTYDVFHGRDCVADRTKVSTEFPGCRDKKLVVVATEAFPDPLTEIGPLLNVLGGMNGVHVVLKLHPEDSLEYFSSYVAALPRNENIDVVKQTDLGALLHTADLLICVLSNIIISAAVMGTPTLVCDFGGRTSVIDFVKEGLCIGCNDPAKLEKTLRSLLFDPSRESDLQRAIKNIRRFNGPNDGRSAQRIVNYVLGRQKS